MGDVDRAVDDVGRPPPGRGRPAPGPGCWATWSRRATAAEADFLRRLLARRAAPGRPRGGDGRRRGPGGRRARRRGAAGRHAVAATWRRVAGLALAAGRAGLDGRRSRAAAPAAAHAGRHRPTRRGRGAGRHRRRGVGGVEARRRPRPGPPPGRRGARLHPQPQRRHPPAARRGGGRAGLPVPGWCSTGRSGPARRRRRGARRRPRRSRTTMCRLRRATTDATVPARPAPHVLRRPPPRRRGPVDRPLASGRPRSPGRPRPGCASPRWSPPTPTRRPRSWRRRCGPATRASMVKDGDSPYEAGRRGKAWRKVKPVRTARPGGAGRRVGPRPAPGLAVQPPPGRPGPGRTRHGS